MRALALSLTGALLVALSGGLGIAAAQSDDQDEETSWPKLTRNLTYGDDFDQVLHVYEPEPRAEPRPAVVLFHGGGLIMGQPRQDTEWAEWLAEQGYVAFMAGYRLFDRYAGANPWPTQIDDAQRAMRWVRAHADEFGVDPERICAAGHSSGGHLAGLVGTTEASADADRELDGVSSRADCVVSISADADFMVPSDDPVWTANVRDQLFGGTVEEVPDVWRSASPAHNVDADTPPFLVIHGTLDEMISIEVARNLVAALAGAGVDHVYEEVPTDHFDVLEHEAFFDLQESFLASQLHPAE